MNRRLLLALYQQSKRCNSYVTSQHPRAISGPIQSTRRNIPTEHASKLLNLPPHLYYTAGYIRLFSDDRSDSTDWDPRPDWDSPYLTPEERVDRKLIHYMDIWDVEGGIKFVKQSAAEDVYPSGSTMLNFYQQLANIGEFKPIIELNELFKGDHKVYTDKSFYFYLNDAYFNSGCANEGIDLMKKIYSQKNNFDDVSIFFTLITITVMKHFPDQLQHIEDFVNECKENDIYDPIAFYWKCLILSERFEEAETLLEEHIKVKQIKSLVHIMVNDICTRSDRVTTHRDVVLQYLTNFEWIRRKQKCLLYETTLAQLCFCGKREDAIALAIRAKNLELPLHRERLVELVQTLDKLSELEPPDPVIQELIDWINTLD
ncbi:unnamed protein product [Owenia fusiformis]|uniref:Uncharacterized protein n=1 Tax=Owenia fusiformis TaxID=6347 RepID=A0A8J1TBY3_OWEFU|nr:unnamed protein product [Owenia fusiformis]